MKKILTLLLFSIMAFNCDRPELKVGPYYGTAKLIGREICTSDTSLSYWIFDITRIGYGDSTDAGWGKQVIVNDTIYRRAIKTRELPTHYVLQNAKYNPVLFQKYWLEYGLYNGETINCFRNNKINGLPEVKLKSMYITN